MTELERLESHRKAIRRFEMYWEVFVKHDTVRMKEYNYAKEFKEHLDEINVPAKIKNHFGKYYFVIAK